VHEQVGALGVDDEGFAEMHFGQGKLLLLEVDHANAVPVQCKATMKTLSSSMKP
jgi:hypothetical protein